MKKELINELSEWPYYEDKITREWIAELVRARSHGRKRADFCMYFWADFWLLQEIRLETEFCTEIRPFSSGAPSLSEKWLFSLSEFRLCSLSDTKLPPVEFVHTKMNAV